MNALDQPSPSASEQPLRHADRADGLAQRLRRFARWGIVELDLDQDTSLARESATEAIDLPHEDDRGPSGLPGLRQITGETSRER